MGAPLRDRHGATEFLGYATEEAEGPMVGDDPVADVRVLQDFLTRAGYATPVAGVFGPQTARSLATANSDPGVPWSGDHQARQERLPDADLGTLGAPHIRPWRGVAGPCRRGYRS